MFSLNINDIKEITDDLFGALKDFSNEIFGGEELEIGEAQDAFEFSSNLSLYTVHTSLLEDSEQNFAYQRYESDDDEQDDDSDQEQNIGSAKISDDSINQDQSLSGLSCVAPSFTPLIITLKETSAPSIDVVNNTAVTSSIEQPKKNCFSRCFARY